jgi:surfeit locus 1 family protein
LTAPAGAAARPLRRRGWRRIAVAGVAGLACAGLAALGTWQLERRAWKHALIERVEARLARSAVPAPAPDRWPRIDAERDEYRRVHARGVFLHERETLVQAVTALGSGYWVLTPLATSEGFTVLVNRGFVPPERRERGARGQGNPAGAVSVGGLLRVSEPGGAFLRRNDPAADRWYSRDVQAIAAARGLERVAPYFIDAEAASGNEAAPIGGLTVVSFRDNHLVYALTWYLLCAMTAGAALRLLRERE